MTTTVVTVLMCATVFQRRSRSGFLDEMEMVRGEALDAPKGEVSTAVAMADAAAAHDRLSGKAGDEPEWHGWPDDDRPGTDADEIWAQPSPHPIRPQEMWHPASSLPKLDIGQRRDRAATMVPAPASTDSGRDEATDDVDPAAGSSEPPRRRFARFRPADALSEAATAPAPTDGPEVPIIPSSDAQSLLGGPVGRRDRSRRDRRPLATAPLRSRPEAPEDQSPLTEALLPPAATRPDPAAPASSEAEHVNHTPEPAVATRPELTIDDRSELSVGATVVRFGDGSCTSMEHGDEGPVVEVDEGWCWVTIRGDGSTVPVRIHLPNGDLMVEAGGRALAVVEADRSSFVVLVEGTAELVRPGRIQTLGTGSMVLLPETGEPQVDQAEPTELEADPLVARNLELDAAR